MKDLGFTLAEVLVVVALLLVAMVLGLGIFLNNNLFYENQTGKIEIIHATRMAADLLAEYGREAIGFETSRVYSGTTYTTAATAVVFRLPGRDASGDILSGVFDYVIVTQDPSDSAKLKLIVDADVVSARPDRELLITDRLTSLAFTYDNVDLAAAGNVDFTITATARGRNPATESVYGQITLRN